MKAHRLFNRMAFAWVTLSLAIAFLSAAQVNAQTPFSGFPFGLPTTIECKQFDEGADGWSDIGASERCVNLLLPRRSFEG